MAKAHFTADIDNTKFKQKVADMRNDIKKVGSTTAEASNSMSESLKKIGTAIGVTFGVSQLISFERQIVSVRGEFQQLEVAFNTMLGSKEKADRLLSQAINFAATTPFDVQQVSQGTKQLLAYGSAAEDVIDEMKMLGNIAAGLSIPLNDIVYLFGTTRTQGRMYTQDLRQFMGRGIPLAEELAKQFGVTKDKVGELVTEGKVGFEEMNKALQAMTSEGGKFYNLMEEQSKTIAGQISNLQDAFQQMLNNMGRNQEGIISGALNAASYLVENYEKFGRVLKDIIILYGSYKASVIAVNAATAIATEVAKGYTAAEMAQYRALLLVEKAQAALNKTMLKNPYIVLGTALVASVAGMVRWVRETEKGAKGIERFNDYVASENEALEENRQANEKLLTVAEDANKSYGQRIEAIESLKEKYPEIIARYKDEADALKNILEIRRLINDEEEKRQSDDDTSRYYDLLRRRSEIQKAIDIANKQGHSNPALYSELSALDKEIELVNERLEAYRDAQWQKLQSVAQGEEFKRSIADIRKEIATAESELKALRAKSVDGLTSTEQEKIKSLDETLKALRAEETLYTGTKDNGKQLEASRQAARDEVKSITESKRQTSRLIQELDAQTEDAEIALIRDGAERKAREREAAYRREQRQIEKQYADTIAAEQERQQEMYRAQHNGSDSGYEFQENDVTSAALAAYNAQRKALDISKEQERAKDAQDEAEAMRSYLEQWGDYEQKRLAITQRYAKERLEAVTEGERLSIDAQEQQELDNLERAYGGTLAKIFRDASTLARGELTESLQLAQNKLKELQSSGKSSVEDIKDLQEQVDRLQEALLDIEPIDFGARWSDVAAQIKENGKLQELYNQQIDKSSEGAQNLASRLAKGKESLAAMIKGAGLNMLADGLSMAADAMGRLADTSGDNRLREWSEGMSVASSALQSALAGFANGGPLGAAIAAGTSLLGTGISKLLEYRAATLDSKKAADDYTASLKLLNLQVTKTSSLFGDKVFEVGADAFRKAKEAAWEYSLIMTELANKKIIIDGKNNNINGLYSLGIINGYGDYDFDKLREWYDKFRDKIYDENVKTAIEQALALADAEKAALESLDDSLSTFTSRLSGQLADAIWDGVVLGGEDAWEQWEKISADMVAKVGKQVLQERFINTYLDGFNERIRNAMGSGDATNLTDVMNDIIDGFPAIFNQASEAALAFKARMEAEGINFNKETEDERSSLAKQGVQATQESVDRQSGILTSIQDYVYRIDEKVAAILARGDASNAALNSVLSILGGIKSDTARLAAIESSLDAMRSDINGIALRGVNLRS